MKEWKDACVGGSDFYAYCAPGSMGPLCAVCEPSHYRNGDSGECKKCEATVIPPTTFYTAPFLALYAFVFVLLVIYMFRFRLDVNNDGKVTMEDFQIMFSKRIPRLTSLVMYAGESQAIKILLTLYQV